MHMGSALNWFEIPVADLDRAAKFYETVLGEKLQRESMGKHPMAIFPHPKGGVRGALVAIKNRQPSADGPAIYLNADGKLDACLQRVESSGGKVVLTKTDIGKHGFIAHVRDTEGNVLGLHSPR